MSILKVPVVETVITQEQLETEAINDINRLTTKVPGLVLGTGALAIGQQISLRGVGTSAQDAGIDQSVSLNLDGVPMAQGVAYRAGLFDVAQVEVLKGPQALFYGKASTGGVISLRTADPGDEFELTLRAGYEFEADEKRGELIMSIPITPTAGFRLAAMYSDMEGFFRNRAVAQPGTGALTPKFDRFDNTHSHIVRGTLTFEPSPAFDVRFKYNHTREKVDGNATHNQLSSCPDGTASVVLASGIVVPRFLSPFDDCELDRTAHWVDLDPAFFIGIRNNGVPFIDTRQQFGSLELTFRPTDELTLTSVSGYYRLKTDVFINSTASGFAATFFVTDNTLKRKDFTQELRLDSDFNDFPVNFTLGAFYQDAEVNMTVRRFVNTAFPATLNGQPFNTFRTGGATNGGNTVAFHDVDIRTYAAFGQLRWRPVETLEIAAGARYTDEKRTETLTNLTPGTAFGTIVRLRPTLEEHPFVRAKNWSPELTITYTPTDDLTIFGSLKQAYKSGGFTLTQLFAQGFDNSFGDEKVQGGEVGLKARLLDRALFINLAGYYYKYKGLQVGTSETGPTGQPLARTINAGGARTFGIDFDFTYRPPAVDGLTLTGAINWNNAKFTDLDFIPCWQGQLISEGCNQTQNPANGLFTAQSLDGLQLIRAPKWQLMAGADYEMAIGNGMTLAFGVDGQFTSSYPTNLSRRDDIIQDSYFFFNATAALRGRDDAWEVALIGNNLFNKIISPACTHAPFAVSSSALGVITGGNVRGPAGVAETMCQQRRGREAWLRLTLRPSVLAR